MSKKLVFELLVVLSLIGIALLLSQLGVSITGLVSATGLIAFISLSSRINLVSITRNLTQRASAGTAESAH